MTDRVIDLANSISENPECSINAASGNFSASKAAFRFFQNEKVNSVAILGKHVENTLEREKSCHSRVLVIQDTTDSIYTQFPSIQDLGQTLKDREGYKDGVSDLLLHSSFVVSSEGVPLGVLKQTFYTYDQVREKRGQSAVNARGLNKKIPVEQKVSHRRIDHLSETSRVLAAKSSQVVHVADRECDIYEFLQSASDHDCQYVVRSSWNRRTHEGQSFHAASTLEEKLANVSAEDKITLVIDGMPVDFCIKKVSILLKPPQRCSEAKSIELAPLRVGVVDIQ